MFSKADIRRELERLGLEDINKNGGFHTQTVESSFGYEYAAPIIQVDGMVSFGDVQGYNSTRKLVFPYANALLKTGESGASGFLRCAKDHERPEEKKGRMERIFTEFSDSTKASESGLPVVRPVCLIHALKEDEYLLVEPQGIHLKLYMDSLLSNYADKQRELEATVEALGRFFRTLREHNVSYKPLIQFRHFVFEHMLRFDSDGNYRILLTDNPWFIEGYSPYGIHRDIIRRLKQRTSKDKDLAAVVKREYRKGLVGGR